MKIKTKNILRRFSVLALCVFMLFASSTAFTYAWQDFTQHTIQLLWGESQLLGSAVLTKYEKGKDGTDGSQAVLLPGARFRLYLIADDLTETQIGGSYTTDANGQLAAYELPPGNYVFVEITPPFGYEPDVDEAGQPITRYPFSIHEQELNPTVKAFNRRVLGGLTLTKTVQNQSGRPLTNAQTEQEFTFTVTFSDGGTYDCSIDGGTAFPVASGSTIQLKHGQRAVFNNIPQGVRYTIRETATAGYATSSQNFQGHISAQQSLCEFVNVFQDGNAQGSLRITKTTGGSLALPEDEFVFTVTFEGGGSYDYSIDGGGTQSLASGETLTLRGGQSAEFLNLPAGMGYTVTETAAPAGYVGAVSSVSGQIIEAGSLAAFYNHHEVEQDIPGNLSIAKQLAGDDTDPNKEFAFTVTFSDGGTYNYAINGGAAQSLASGETLNLKGGESALFEGLPHGITYTVEEADYSGDGYLSYMRRAEGTILAEQTAALVFVNEKNAPTTPQDTLLRVRKIVDGPATDQKFNITVTIDHAANGTHEVHELALGHDETWEITLPYGTNYEVSEQDYFPDGYTETTTHASGTAQGETEIEATVTNTWARPEMLVISGEKTWNTAANPSAAIPAFITLRLKNGSITEAEQKVYPGEDGKWAYSFTVPKYGADGKEINYALEEVQVNGFASIYEQNGNTINLINTAYGPLTLDLLSARKQITGDAAPANSEFRFSLAALQNAPMPEGAVNNVKIITVTGQGTGSFGSITYTQPGTYRYRVQEVNDGLPGYTYDTTSYTLTAVVREVDGVLVAEPITVEKNGEVMQPAPQELDFTNQYTTSSDPTSSSDPKDPTSSSDPKDPTSSSDPKDPTSSSDPKDPTSSSDPKDPTKSTESKETTNSTGSNTINSKDPTNSTSSSSSTGESFVPGGGNGTSPTDGNGTSPTGGHSPQTNDGTRLWLMGIIFMVSALGFGGMVMYFRYQKSQQKIKAAQKKLYYKRKKVNDDKEH